MVEKSNKFLRKGHFLCKIIFIQGALVRPLPIPDTKFLGSLVAHNSAHSRRRFFSYGGQAGASLSTEAFCEGWRYLNINEGSGKILECPSLLRGYKNHSVKASAKAVTLS